MMRFKTVNWFKTIFQLAAIVGLLSCLSALSNTTKALETNSSAIKTYFAEDGKLTDDEIDQVIHLAGMNGLTNAAEIGTFDYIPAGGIGIWIKSEETQKGRNIYFDSLYINKIGWRNITTNANTKFIGNFSADKDGKFSSLLRTYQSINGQSFRVSIGEGVSLKLADTVVGLLISNKLQFPTNSSEANFLNGEKDKKGQLLPESIQKDDSENLYEMELRDYPHHIQFKSKRGKIVVTNVYTYLI